MKVTVSRKAHFNAAHRLYRSDWSFEKNDAIFGKCNNPNYHGHNYVLEVKVIGEVNPQTGYVMDTKILSDIIKREVTERYDHKNLNLDIPEFKSLNPTAENIAAEIYKRLRGEIPEELELKVRLYETERNIVEYPA